MAKNEQPQVMVITVANGYIVRPADQLSQDRHFFIEASHVFESFESMTKYLREVLPSIEEPKRTR